MGIFESWMEKFWAIRVQIAEVFDNVKGVNHTNFINEAKKKKFALVTGGSRGIGEKAICLQLAREPV